MASASFMVPGWAIVGLAALLAGCGSDTEPGQGSPAIMEPDGGPSEKQPGPLPGSSTDGDCEADEPVELCAWADAADAVVLATIDGVEAASVPRAMPSESSDSGWEWDDTCTVFNTGLRLDLLVDEVLMGVVDERAEVYLGATQTGQFKPLPSVNAAGELEWLGSPGSGSLQAGQQLLIGLYALYEPAGTWSIMGQPLVGLAEDGTLVPQESVSECPPASIDVTGLTPAALSEELQQCPADAGDARRELVLKQWGPPQPPWYFMSSRCIEQPGTGNVGPTDPAN